jgi:hypothetical protein
MEKPLSDQALEKLEQKIKSRKRACITCDYNHDAQARKRLMYPLMYLYPF